jgi:hypothetical protein
MVNVDIQINDMVNVDIQITDFKIANITHLTKPM